MAETRGPATSLDEAVPPDKAAPLDRTAAGGQQLLPLIEHLARVGHRAAGSCMSGCLRPRHLIALRLLAEHGPMSQHAVGAALSLDPSNVVGLLNELEERGLIARRRDPADRRRHIVELSATGSGELGQTYDRLGEVEDELFKTLTAAQRAALHDLLSRAVSALAPDWQPACAATPPTDRVAPRDDRCGGD
ncbi:MAG TPA: MarR family winged helix-turn-helix transcriptional regulator [Trebonia sp.]|nr:MarR family winged helix-turn-helix transcriptional regulator [Trebonia sp.]